MIGIGQILGNWEIFGELENPNSTNLPKTQEIGHRKIRESEKV
jgi:hypothetical protein